MSRTVRKRHDTSVRWDWWNGLDGFNNPYTDPKDEQRAKAKSTSDYVSGWYSLPKYFRKTVTHARRARDRREVHKMLGNPEYVPNMSPWTCKDANTWGYW